MKLDTHVHTVFSGHSTLWPLHRLLRESYNTPERVYRRAKARGMDLVTITDHDRIDGALLLAHREDVIIGCEITAVFPRDGVRVHLGVLGITEPQHREILKRRHDIGALLPYLREQHVFVSLNHVASRVNGRITGTHVAAVLPWINGLEVRNGSRLPVQNATAARLASANGKVAVAGSDSHAARGIGQTYVEAPHATTRAEFLTELHAGRVRVAGRQGSYLTMASDIMRIATNFYTEELQKFGRAPWQPRRQAMAVGMALGLPLIGVPLVAACCHFMLERRFNRTLLADVVQQRDLRLPEMA